jgi:putative membrane protein
MMILFWGGIILAIVFAVRWLGGATSHSAAPPTSRKSALDILQDRFARGEIDKDEFEERKRLLSD